MSYITFSIYWLALSMVANSLHPIILPTLVGKLAPLDSKATYLGFLTFAGLVVAILVQPLMGGLSDRCTSRWGRRRPFILVGTLLALFFLVAIASASSYWALLAGVLLLQFASNTAQGPYQALLPDLVPEERRGRASAVKGLSELLGGVIGTPIAAYLIHEREGNLAIGFTMLVLLPAMLITLFAIREEPLKEVPREPLKIGFLSSFKVDIRNHPDFIWWLLNRFLLLLGLTGVQAFALYFIEDTFSLPNPARATSHLTVIVGLGILITIIPAGHLGDRLGHKPLLVIAGLGGTVGVFLLALLRSYAKVLTAGVLIGSSFGLFISASWALVTKLVPQKEAGRYLGFTNLATAGGSAAARLEGPLIDFFNSRSPGQGYTALFLANGFFVLLSTLAILKVRESAAAQIPCPNPPCS